MTAALAMAALVAASPPPALRSADAAPCVGPRVHVGVAPTVTAASRPGRRVLVDSTPVAPGAADRWLGADKVKHFFLAGFAESVGYAAVRASGGGRRAALGGGVALAGAVSVGREVQGRRAGAGFSLRDLAWDAAGMLVHGALLARVGR